MTFIPQIYFLYFSEQPSKFHLKIRISDSGVMTTDLKREDFRRPYILLLHSLQEFLICLQSLISP